jgi:hypothetical protein
MIDNAAPTKKMQGSLLPHDWPSSQCLHKAWNHRANDTPYGIRFGRKLATITNVCEPATLNTG